MATDWCWEAKTSWVHLFKNYTHAMLWRTTAPFAASCVRACHIRLCVTAVLLHLAARSSE